MPTIPASMAPLIDQYMRETGQMTDSPAALCHSDKPDEKPQKRRELMAPSLFVEPATWVVPIRLQSEMNKGVIQKGSMSRNKHVKNAIYRALGPHWRIWGPVGDRIRAGHPCSIKAIRLGGTGLDVANLWAAMKFPEDAIANMLGCEDGWPVWKQSFSVDQEPGRLWGLRIEMQVPPPPR